LSIGYQIASNPMNAQKILRRACEAARIDLDRIKQTARHIAQSNTDGRLYCLFLFHEREFRESNFRGKRYTAQPIYASRLFHPLSPKSVSRDHSK
jgi:hypothetical protein